ncbi:hypothetical protein JCM10295v2_005558 [Rhodotorula toruloides]
MRNRSCHPNALCMNVGDVMVVRARTAIAEGDEICISYVPSSSTQTVTDNILRQRAMTGCGCAICREAAHTDSNQVTKRYKLLDESMTKFSNPLQRSTAGQKARKDMKPSLEKVIKKVEATYTQDGLRFRPDLASIYHVMSEYCDPSTKAGVKWARKALVAAGADFVDRDGG